MTNVDRKRHHVLDLTIAFLEGFHAAYCSDLNEAAYHNLGLHAANC